MAAIVVVCCALLVVRAAAAPVPERILIRAGGEKLSVYAAHPESGGCQRVLRLVREAGNVISPDGRWIARLEGDREVAIVSLADGRVRTVGRTRVRPPSSLLWSKDGRQLAFDDGASLVIVAVEGKERRRVRLRTRPFVTYSPLAWSPDRSMIALRTTWGSGRAGTLREDFEVVTLAGGNLSRLQRNPDPDSSDFSPDWSPDGETVVYDAGDPGEIFSIHPDGSGRRQLTDRRMLRGDRGPVYDRDPLWSPDGSRIAFTSSRNGGEEVYVMNADGSTERRLTVTQRPPRGTPQLGSALLAWSPEGTRLAVDRQSVLALIDVDANSRRELCKFPILTTSISAGVWAR